MASVYENIVIGTRLDVKDAGRIITTTKGDLLTDNGTKTVRIPIGTNGQAIVADSSQTSGLLWKSLTPGDVSLDPGAGLTLTGSTLDVGGSATIIANADNLEVNSSSTANQVLLSTGTTGTAATYGALPLNNSSSVTGVLPVANGGTSASSFAAGSRLISTNAGNTALEATSLNPSTIVTLADVQTLTNKSLMTPVVETSINDANNNELVNLTSTSSAVNQVNVTNAATGNSPTVSASGDDTNIDLNVNAKGTGNVKLSGIAYPNADGSNGQVLATNGSGVLSFSNVPILSTGTASTTDATPTTISAVTIATSSDTGYFIDAKFLAKDTTTFDVASFVIKATFKNVTGTLTRVGIDTIYAPQATTWSADVLASGTDIIAQVTGAAATNISWKVEVDNITV